MADASRAAPPDPLVVRVIETLSLGAGIVAAGLIFASVLVTCQMIFVRFVLNASTIWQTEAVVYMMIAATVLGLPYVQKLRGHVNVDLVPLLLPRAVRRVLAVVVLIASLAVAGLMAWYGWELFHIAWERDWKSDTVWGVPLWIPYSVVPLGFVLYILQLGADLFHVRRGETPFAQGALEEDA
jgi:TRAP-type C4-dicarboxylate transport system permease small subunit